MLAEAGEVRLRGVKRSAVGVVSLALLLGLSGPAEARTRKCMKPAGFRDDGRIKAVNIGCDEARRVFRRYTFSGRGVSPCDPCTVTTAIASYTCRAHANVETYTGRVTCRRDKARVVTWRYSFMDE